MKPLQISRRSAGIAASMLLLGPAASVTIALMQGVNYFLVTFAAVLGTLAVVCLLVRLSVLSIGATTTLECCFPHHELLTALEEGFDSDSVKAIDILVAQAVSVRSFVTSIIRRHRLLVRLVVHNPAATTSTEQKVTALKALHDIVTELATEPDVSRYLEIFLHDETPSVRIIAFEDASGRFVRAGIGWYSHADHGRTIGGSRYPSLLVRTGDEHLLPFAEGEFRAKLRAATLTSPAEIQDRYANAFLKDG